MKVEVPFEIGDPVIQIAYNQHDGYYLNYKGFNYSDIPEVYKTIFKTYEEAKTVLKTLDN